MSDKVTMVVSALPNMEEKEALGQYQQKAAELFEAAGGVIKSKLQLQDQVIGEDNRQLTVIVEFPNKEAITGVINSAEYQAIIPLRDKGFAKLDAYVGSNA